MIHSLKSKKPDTDTIFLLGVSLLTTLIYAYGFDGAFAYDDYNQILNRPKIQNIFNLHDVIFNGLRQHRLWQNLAFGFSWTLSEGATWSFKLISLILHLLNAWVLFQWLKRFFSDHPRLPFFATALFLIHPLQIQSVTYVMGIVILFQSFFYLMALYWYSKYRLSRMGGLIAILFLSLFSKETATLIPIVLAAYEFLVLRKPEEKIEWKKWGILFLVPFLLIPIYEILKDPISMFEGVTGFKIFPFFPYIGAQFYYQVHYLFQLFNPTLQAIIHDIPVYNTYGIACAVLGGLLWAYCGYFILFRWKKYPRIALLMILYLVSYIPTNSFLQMINPYAEYRLYLTNAILFMAMARFLVEVPVWMGKFQSFRMTPWILNGTVFAYFSFFTWLNVLTWKDELKIFEQALKLYPESYTINRSMAVASLHQKKNDDALYYFILARFINGSMDAALRNDLFTTAGILYKEGSYPQAWFALQMLEKESKPDELDPNFDKLKEVIKTMMLRNGLSLDTNFEELKQKYQNLMKHRHSIVKYRRKSIPK